MDIQGYLQQIHDDAEAALAQLAAPPSSSVVVKAGDNLQTALDAGGQILLEDGATFTGNFFLRKSGTIVLGSKANLVGAAGGPALKVPIGGKNVKAVIQQATTAWDQRVIEIGDNNITSIDDVPDGVEITCFVPQHRGKTAFAISGKNVKLINCGCADVYAPSGQDSQGIGILNTPGPVYVSGGTFEAASENILVGGNATGIVGVQPTDLVFEDVTLVKRLDWFANNLPSVKNLFELKSGVNVTLRRAKLSGCWPRGQSGFAIMLTPRDGKLIQNVLLEDVDVTEVAAVVELMGYDDSAYSPLANGFVFRRLNGTTTRSRGGNGWFAALLSELSDVVFDSCTYNGQNSFITSSANNVWDSPTSKRTGYLQHGMQVLNCQAAAYPYGIALTSPFPGTTDTPQLVGYGQNWQRAWPDGVISGNTFTGPSALMMKKNLPVDNTFVNV